MTSAAQGATNAQAAVIATRAAIAPFSIIDTSGFRSLSQLVTAAPITPQAAAMFVVHRHVGEEPDAAEVDPSVEPALNPYQPNQRITTPSVT